MSLRSDRDTPLRAATGARLRAGIAVLVLLAFSLLWLHDPYTPALASEPSDAAAIAEAIERLPVVGSVLLTGAHPDDENNSLLAYLARGMHLRTAYLSETRGDGGQNLLGTEQYEALGMLRTEELLAARRIDGAEQFFGQAYDFGFSKSADETLTKWGHDDALSDYVRVIRQFRPDVVVSRFTGTPADGHGHHQASGILTKEAFRAAADPGRFSSLLSLGLMPWQSVKLFINAGGGGGGGRPPAPGTFTVAIGGFSPLYGEEYGDLGRQARSQHRSQGMGGGGTARGPYTAAFRLADSIPAAAEGTIPKDLFEGIDLTLNRFTTLANGAAPVAQDVQAIQKAVDEARSLLTPLHPEKVLPALAQALIVLRDLETQIDRGNLSALNKDQAHFLLDKKEEDFARAISLAGGVVFEARSTAGELVPGTTFDVTVSARLRGLQSGGIDIEAPQGWKIERAEAPAGAGASLSNSEEKFRVTVPANAPPSQPYWLGLPREKDYFATLPGLFVGAPMNPPLLTAHLKLSLGSGGKSVPLELSDEVVYPYTDRIYGEKEAPLVVVPAVGVWVEPEVTVFPLGANATRSVLVRLHNMTASEQQGTVHLDLSSNWSSVPASAPFTLAKKDETAIRFELAAADSGQSEKEQAKAVADVGGQSYSTGFQVIDYPHVHTRYLFHPAVLDLLRFDVKVAPGLKIGYVMGSGDEVPDALKQLGVEVTQLNPEDLAFGNLKQYDAVVTGIRAYEVRKDLASNNARLMDYVSGGGTMIVQYSRPGGFSDPLGPYPLSLGSQPRVSVEEVPVAILDPAHPLFHFPNEITQQDFDGWVQERGTYFMEKWSPEYKPLLESHDPGEPPQNGGMLIASYGKGQYIYTGYVWFRQLPAGVPGAYRIFANLISLGKAPRN